MKRNRALTVACAMAIAALVGACAKQSGEPEATPAAATQATEAAAPAPRPHPPVECGTARSTAECAEILERLGKDTAPAFGTGGVEPLYTGVPETELPPCKSGADNCEPWERMWHQ